MPVPLADGLAVTPLVVPHRQEFSEVVGYRIDGPDRSALFIPDIDSWHEWDDAGTRLEDVLALEKAHNAKLQEALAKTKSAGLNKAEERQVVAACNEQWDSQAIGNALMLMFGDVHREHRSNFQRPRFFGKGRRPKCFGKGFSSNSSFSSK